MKKICNVSNAVIEEVRDLIRDHDLGNQPCPVNWCHLGTCDQFAITYYNDPSWDVTHGPLGKNTKYNLNLITSYNKIIPQLKGSDTEFLLTKKFANSFMWRLIRLKQGQAYPPHQDKAFHRIHVPIYTNSDAKMAIWEDHSEGKKLVTEYHFPVGEAWAFREDLTHSAYNCGPGDRWHLIGISR